MKEYSYVVKRSFMKIKYLLLSPRSNLMGSYCAYDNKPHDIKSVQHFW